MFYGNLEYRFWDFIAFLEFKYYNGILECSPLSLGPSDQRSLQNYGHIFSTRPPIIIEIFSFFILFFYYQFTTWDLCIVFLYGKRISSDRETRRTYPFHPRIITLSVLFIYLFAMTLSTTLHGYINYFVQYRTQTPRDETPEQTVIILTS